MHRLLLCTVALLSLSAVARADAIDDFTFTSASHTFTFSLPALIPNYYPPGYPPPGPHVGIDNYFTSAPGAIDGVGGHVFALDFATLVSPFPLSLGFTVDGSSSTYYANGQHLVGAPFSFFPTGTFALADSSIPQPDSIRDGPYTLTITPEAATSATPEPSSLILLGTGLLGAVGVTRRRLHL